MICFLLFVFLGGCINQADSLDLTSSPLTATEGELFTLICSSNTTGGQDRQWYRDGTLLFTTTRGSSSPSVANSYIVNMYLSGRVNVSCDPTQHNVTLRINSSVDSGSKWQCLDNGGTTNNQRSNILTINVTVEQTAVTTTTTTTDVASVTSATTSNINSFESTDVNVTETPPSSMSTHLNTTSVTTFASTTSNNNNNKTTRGKPTSMSGFTTTTITINTAGESADKSNNIAIAAGAAGGCVAVIAVVIVAAICIRKRRRSVEENVKDKTRHDRNPSRSAEMLIESGVPGEDEKVMMDNIIYTSSSEVVPTEYSVHDHNQADKVMQDNILYTSSSDIAPADFCIQDPNHVGKDVYTQVKTNADQNEVTDEYAKPHKRRNETPNGDVYAKVNKVKSGEGTSENIEDMYAKPQKDKRNLKRNPGPE